MASTAITQVTQNPNGIPIPQGAAPATPAAGVTVLYADVSGHLHQFTSSTDTDLGAGGAGVTLGALMAMGF